MFDVRCQEALSDRSNKECGRADANQHDDDGDDLALGCLWRDVAAKPLRGAAVKLDERQEMVNAISIRIEIG